MNISNMLRTIKAAAIQAEPVILDCEATVDKACHLISEAASKGAQLIVFPELFIRDRGFADFVVNFLKASALAVIQRPA